MGRLSCTDQGAQAASKPQAGTRDQAAALTDQSLTDQSRPPAAVVILQHPAGRGTKIVCGRYAIRKSFQELLWKCKSI